MVLIVSLIDCPLIKRECGKKTQDPLGEFRPGHFACLEIASGDENGRGAMKYWK
jgi:hypothetical protein